MLGEVSGRGSFLTYAILASIMVLVQYLIGPAIVGWTMKVRWVTEQEEPELHRMVADLAREAHIKKPKVGISGLNIPNAFAYGRFGDARVVVTDGIRSLLTKDELRAVVGHEVSHVKHHDMVIITILSVVPLILWYIAWGIMWSGGGRDRRNGGQIALIGFVAFILYFVTNLLVLYASRIREYYADLGSVRLGNEPKYMASALYKLVYGTARTSKEELKQVEGVKAFFANDPTRALKELRELREIDRDMSGTIDANELSTIRGKKVVLGFGDKMMEALSTHPNMLKRIKHLSTLMFASQMSIRA